ncbi:MAG: hypothetical protein GY796_36895 [Chloroflexi bacterium]|nr:hypothetical protein [Chloroflexota bacterium]
MNNSLNMRLGFALVWIVGCTVTTLMLLRRGPRSLPRWPILLFAALLLRLVPALALPNGASYEMEVFRQTVVTLRTGQSVYLTQLAHPYLPLQLYWFGAAHWLAELTPLNFVFWLKSINIVADTLLAGLVYLSIRHLRNKEQANWGGWIYAFNPVTMMVVAYQGQFDAVPLLFLLLAWYLLLVGRDNGRFLTLSALALGVAVLSKTWPLLFLPMVLLRLPTWKQRLTYTLLMGAVPSAGILLYELLFPNSLMPMLRRASQAGAISGWWGYSSILNVWGQMTGSGGKLYAWVGRNGKLLGYLFGLIMIVWTRKRPLLTSLLLTMLAMFTAVPNLGLQGLSWIVPVAVILGISNELGWYILGAAFHMIVSYWGIHLARWWDFFFPKETANMIIQLSSLAVWLVVVAWLVQELIHRRLLPMFFFGDGRTKKPSSLT